MNIKDFILKDLTNIQAKETTKQKSKPEIIFNLDYENDYDFILTRKTKTTDRTLVFLISQAQIYIKNNKNGEISLVNHVSDINTFKQGLTFKPFKTLIWNPFGYDKHMLSTIIYHKDSCKYLCNKKYNIFHDSGLISEYERNSELFKRKDSIVNIFKSLDPDFRVTSWSNERVVKNFYELKLDINFINKYRSLIDELSVGDFISIMNHDGIVEIVQEYNCDFVSFLKYVIYTIKNRNRLTLHWGQFDLWDYKDYLRMQKEMYGKVKEKYPVYWLSEKSILSNKYNEYKRLQKEDLICLNQSKMKQYLYEDKTYKVVIPESSVDILDEAEQQHHCLAMYVDKIRDGQTNVVFIRQQLAPDVSCLTVEIRDNRIIQIKGLCNRAPNEEEMKFVKKWCKSTKLQNS